MSSSSHCNDLNQASASSSGGTDDTGSSEEIYADIISRIRLCQTYMNDALANNRPADYTRARKNVLAWSLRCKKAQESTFIKLQSAGSPARENMTAELGAETDKGKAASLLIEELITHYTTDFKTLSSQTRALVNQDMTGLGDAYQSTADPASGQAYSSHAYGAHVYDTPAGYGQTADQATAGVGYGYNYNRHLPPVNPVYADPSLYPAASDQGSYAPMPQQQWPAGPYGPAATDPGAQYYQAHDTTPGDQAADPSQYYGYQGPNYPHQNP